MSGGDTRSFADQEDAARRSAEIIRMKREGKSFTEIGEHFGFSRQNAHEQYWKAIEAIPAKEANALRSEQLDQLNYVSQQVAVIMQKDHLAVSQGKVVRLGEPEIVDGEAVVFEGSGEPVLDDMPKIAAARELRMLSAQVAKLMGLEIPVKQEFGGDVTVRHVVEADGFNPGDLT